MASDHACAGVSADAFVAYVRGELAVSDALRLERHVGRCPSCAACLAREASFEASLYELGEIVEAELHVPAHRRWLHGLAALGSRLHARLRVGARPAWGSLALASALAFVVCDHAAMRGMLDEASPAPGSVALRSRDAAPLDESPPACEEPALMGIASLDGPACLEPIAMATFPPEPDPFEAAGWQDEDVCAADDGGDLVCDDRPGELVAPIAG